MKKIIIYDKRRYFFRFLKAKYRNKYSFTKHVDLNDSNIENTNNLFLIIFVVYDNNDILTFLNYYSLTDRIIVCSNSLTLLEKYKKIKYIDLLNTNILKPKISQFIDSKFESLNKTIE